MDRTPTLDDLALYQVNRPGQAEVFKQSLYDFQIYATAGSAQFAFFQQPGGAGITSTPGAVVGSAKSKNDTNMTLAGNLPQPQAFLIESIEFLFIPGSSATANTFLPAQLSAFNAVAADAVLGSIDDINTVLNAGALQLFIGSKEYLFETPLFRFPPKCYIGADAAVASNSATTAEVAVLTARAMGRPYFLDTPIALMANQNFSVNVIFPAAVATPSGFNARMGVVLDGYFFRNSQ